MPKATFDDLLNEVRDLFLQIRVLSGGYGPAVNVLQMSVAAVWPKLGRLRRERLPQVVQRQLIKSTKMVSDLTLLFPSELTDSLRSRLPAIMAVVADRRPYLLEWWAKLPPMDRSLIDAYYRQVVSEISPAREIVDFTRLHLELLHLLDRAVPVASVVACETDETDVARLVLQRVVGDCPEDRRVILETLLIGENGNQQFYLRLMNVVAELEWLLGPKPDWAGLKPPPPAPIREKLVTWAFLVGCAVAVSSVIYAIIR
ncbi:hypothetical protein [Zavarzinella formosa]|uniref:hypothetical protein n=1 Tax=Zavarzinella formosa TaxID=360055 RepID=UPI0012F98D75|nr:hypothetical protein [Zavarzinella formosa]